MAAVWEHAGAPAGASSGRVQCGADAPACVVFGAMCGGTGSVRPAMLDRRAEGQARACGRYGSAQAAATALAQACGKPTMNTG